MKIIASSDADQRAFAAATATIAVVAGEMAFQFGTSGTVFYSRFLTLAVLGLVAFASTFVVTPSEEGQRTWAVRTLRFCCLIPLGILAVFAVDDIDSSVISLLEIVALLAAPVVLAVLAQIFGVDASTLPRKLQVLSAATVAVAVIGSFVVGNNHSTFFSCDQFRTAGDNVPDDCFEEEA